MVTDSKIRPFIFYCVVYEPGWSEAVGRREENKKNKNVSSKHKHKQIALALKTIPNFLIT